MAGNAKIEMPARIFPTLTKCFLERGIASIIELSFAEVTGLRRSLKQYFLMISCFSSMHH